MYIFVVIKQTTMMRLLKKLQNASKGRLKALVDFSAGKMDIFLLLVIGLAIWYLYGMLTMFYDPTAPMSIWTPFISTFYAIIQLIIGIFIVMVIVRVVWPGMYRIIDESFEEKEDSKGYHNTLTPKEKWYVSFFVYFFLLFLFVLLLRII